jgi:uncharacterized protein (DUF1697 family)
MLALLRAINVGGRSLPMASLRSLCESIGWRSVRTYIQSGNVVFESQETPTVAARRLENAIATATSLKVPVVVRTSAEWTTIVDRNPFIDLDETQWKRLLVGVAVERIADDAAEKLAGRAATGERIAKVGDALWIYFEEGVARSRVTPAAIDRAAGSSVTTRNLNTVLKLQEMLTA